MTVNCYKKPKVAYIMTPITFGGAERVDLNFLNNVARDRFTIEPILFLRPWEPVNYFETELTKLDFNYFIIPVAKSDSRDSFRVVRCLFMLLKLFKGKSYNLIHTHGYLADILGVFVSKVFNIPIISTCHGFIFEGKRLSFYNNLDCFALRYFDRIIAVSNPLKSQLISKNISKEKITVIENTPDFSQSNIAIPGNRNQLRNDIGVESDEILIGFVGRLSAEKGIMYLLESIKLLENSSQSFKLVLIGEGPQDIELKEIVHQYNLSAQVIFAGFQKNIDEWLGAIDIFVLPSLTEGTPMVLLEAMAHGVPCIASAVGGIPFVIESGVDGILVSPGQPGDIRDAIKSLGTDINKRYSIASNAQKKIESKYNITEWAKKIELEYSSILNLVQVTSV